MGTGANKTNTLEFTDNTMFDVHKQQVVAYSTDKAGEEELVTPEARNILGHLLIKALAEAGISPDKLLRNKEGRKELQDFISSLAPELETFANRISAGTKGFLIGADPAEAE
jgi:hypothetical protein